MAAASTSLQTLQTHVRLLRGTSCSDPSETATGSGGAERAFHWHCTWCLQEELRLPPSAEHQWLFLLAFLICINVIS